MSLDGSGREVADLHIHADEGGDSDVVRLSGEADLPSIPDIETYLRPLLEPGRVLIVDISELEFCSYSVISALDRLRVAAESFGGDLYVVGATRWLRGVLRKIGLTSILLPEAGRRLSRLKSRSRETSDAAVGDE